MTTTPDLATLAGKLSQAQREALVGWMRTYADPNTILAIRRKGLAIRTTLTPLGIAVREHLMEPLP